MYVKIKKYVFKVLGIIIILLVVLIFYFSINKKIKGEINYTAFNELDGFYSLENAIEDHCVAFEDLSLIAGEKEWKTFLETTKKGNPSNIRIVKYYTKNNNLYVLDLSFDGSKYTINNNLGKIQEYLFLNHYRIEATETINKIKDYYILVNEENVIFEELKKSLLSSKMHDRIAQYRIYTNIYKIKK